jgi:biotin-dependent carboxylase-like uncharacterized protein
MEGNSVLRVLDVGLGVSLQDRGRAGWRRFGVPQGGAMDPHSAQCANRLLDNDSSCAVLEVLAQGAKFEVLQDAWFAICGAEVECGVPIWRSHYMAKGERILFRNCTAGMWSYLAVDGGFAETPVFGSVSYYARGGIGRKLDKGSILERANRGRFLLPRGVSGRFVSWADRREFNKPPKIRVYPGPQWKAFSLADRDRFLIEPWKISAQSDRVGYRLEGPALKAEPPEIYSEPVRLGSIQVPENGQPIITMPDGPTVGGYPKIALIDSVDLPWVAQCRPGESIRFQLVA